MKKYIELLSKKRLDEAEIHRKSSIPSKLIKFFSLCEDEKLNESKFKTLSDQKLYFSKVEKANDPYEFQCMYVNHEKLRNDGIPEAFIKMLKDVLNTLKTERALSSLSGNSFDCLPMWAYYTNNYQGFCVEYDVVKPDKIFKVSYEPKRIPLATFFTDFVDAIQKNKAGKNVATDETEFYSLFLRQQFFLKHKSWEHENEYRIVVPIGEGDGINVDIANVGLTTSRIVAGLHCSPKHKEYLAEISKKLGCNSISVTTISDNEYMLLEDFPNG